MKLATGFIALLGLTVALVPRGVADSADNKIVPPLDDDIAVQTRGPVHEAYAAPVNAAPQPGPIVDKQPPEAVKELPAEQKPEGDNIAWIPGYWAWDTDRNDYVWVSGFWRAAPPGRQWVPGHWTEASGGWQWVAGFWAAANQTELPYIDQAPPESLEQGPSVPAPDDNSQYIPGSWVYQTSNYYWQPGYWTAVRPGYVWVPAQYYWTPAGYCNVDGYWDYPLEDRGLLFAPVCFNRPLWSNPDWYYQPNYCLPFGGLLASLFARPAFCHYYFGDYYGPGYYDQGFYPWFAYGRRWHDPLFGYYRWRHHDDPGWYRGMVADYRARVRGDLPRPPRTFREQNNLAQRYSQRGFNRNALSAVQVVKPLNQMASSGVRLSKPSASEYRAAERNTSAMRNTATDRRRLESRSSSPGGRPAALPLAQGSTLRTQPNASAFASRPSARGESTHSFPGPDRRFEGAGHRPSAPVSPRQELGHASYASRSQPTPPTHVDRAASPRLEQSTPHSAASHPQRAAHSQPVPRHVAQPSHRAAPAQHASPAPRTAHRSTAPAQRHVASPERSAPPAPPSHHAAQTSHGSRSSGGQSGGGHKDNKKH